MARRFGDEVISPLTFEMRNGKRSESGGFVRMCKAIISLHCTLGRNMHKGVNQTRLCEKTIDVV